MKLPVWVGGVAVEWLGRLPYARAHALMGERLEARIAGEVDDALLLCEHEPVYTVGRRRGAEANLLGPGDTPVVRVERGGDVTWHGPGQLVGYPIVALPEGRHDLHGFLFGLEEVLIRALAQFGVQAGRDARNTGVWIEGRKVASIGIACRRWVTWHGFALNVDADLDGFHRINPCGLTGDVVTRLADHLDPCPSIEDLATVVAREFGRWWSEWTRPA